MSAQRSTATIRALANLAELSANQLEEGVSVDDVIATLRRAAEAVRSAVDGPELRVVVSNDDDVVEDETDITIESEEDSNTSSDEEPSIEASETEEEADAKMIAEDQEVAAEESEEEAPISNAG